MLFSEKDRLQAEYKEKFAMPFAERLQAHLPQTASARRRQRESRAVIP